MTRIRRLALIVVPFVLLIASAAPAFAASGYWD